MKAEITKITSTKNKDVKQFRIKFHEKINPLPGQYMILAFPDDAEEKRAFSIVEYYPKTNEGTFYIKKNKKVTSRLFAESPKKELMAYGPYGRFIVSNEKKPIVFIAGGIGITPIYNMVSNLKKNSYSEKITLFYSTKNKENSILLDEVTSLKSEKIKVHTFFTQELKKRIDIETIKKSSPDFHNGLFYICGPESMISSLRQELIKEKINPECIKSEEFD